MMSPWRFSVKRDPVTMLPTQLASLMRRPCPLFPVTVSFVNEFLTHAVPGRDSVCKWAQVIQMAEL